VSLEANQQVSEIVADWARTNGLALGEGSALQLLLPPTPLLISFEPEHLRRVLVNLLDNALRHARPGPGSVAVSLKAASDDWVQLCVFSAAEPMPVEVERHLFEPFFSTRSRGSGLGLYICRELCERYGGRIDYQRMQCAGVAGNAFVLSLRRLSASTTAS
jgi:two-component system sensor histidine kinase PilS (NtrC family)